MQEQYRRLKAECGDALLFFRLGDFYELFGEDAERAAPVLEVVLTSREGTPGSRIPMCGVPHHAVNNYIGRVLARGWSVAIADQVEDPALAKGLVRREIVRLLTPGTVAEPDLIEPLGERLLVAMVDGALAVADVSTGTIRVALLDGGEESAQELHRLGPSELVVPSGQIPAAAQAYAEGRGVPLTQRPAEEFDAQEPRRRWPEAPEDPALGGLLNYLRYVLRGDFAGFRAPETYRPASFLSLDAAAQRNLEVVERLTGGTGPGTLLGAVDRSVTAMGRRMLRQWLLHPLQDLAEIRQRQDGIEELARRPLFREGLRAALRGVYDLERLATRTIAQRATPRELGALGASLRALPEAVQSLAGCSAGLLAALLAAVDPLEEVGALLGRALADPLPVHVRDGGIFAKGYDAALDELRAAGSEGRGWLAELEARERARTGIRSLKIGYNKVFGYFIEVSAANLAAIPEDYQRKQTLANGERFVTPEIKRLEERVLGSEEKALRREQGLFTELRAHVAAHGEALQRTAAAIASLDALAALAETAARWGWTRPVVDRSSDLLIRSGRHPVLEQQMPAGRFVPNDIELMGRGERFVLITGPNMAGKSTYMRQVALIALLAHAGSFVPAAEARVGLVDRIFTRVGASDDLAGGRSTFMVEMTEVASCLRHATRHSLILLDEVGRGTGTLDGLAIAWAVAEDIATRLKARTLFATHYHELTAAVAQLPGAGNAHVAVREEAGGVVFLHRVVPGATDRSYGVAVAALAGVPAPVIGRARHLLDRLQAQGTMRLEVGEAAAAAEPEVPSDPRDTARRHLVRRLAGTDPMRMTPLQALDLLAVLQAEASTLQDEA